MYIYLSSALSIFYSASTCIMDIYCKLTCNMYAINNNNLKMNGISMLAFWFWAGPVGNIAISTVFTFCPDLSTN